MEAFYDHLSFSVRFIHGRMGDLVNADRSAEDFAKSVTKDGLHHGFYCEEIGESVWCFQGGTAYWLPGPAINSTQEAQIGWVAHGIADSVVRRMSATRQTGRVCACPHTRVITTLTGGYVRPSVARAQVKGSATLLQSLQTASLAILIVILATLIIMLCALGLYTMRKRHRKRSSSFGDEQERPYTNSTISLVGQ